MQPDMHRQQVGSAVSLDVLLKAKTEVGYFGGLHLSSLVLLQPF